MKLFKGTDKDLKCRDFQYEIGKEYKENGAYICQCGFHACENPLDVLKYYPPGIGSRYFEVDLDVNNQTHYDSKRVGRRIKIEKEIGIHELAKAHFEYVNKNIKKTIGSNREIKAIIGDYGSAIVGKCGNAIAGESGSAIADGSKIVPEHNSAIAGNYGSAIAGDHGNAIAGKLGSAMAGNFASAIAGDNGCAVTEHAGSSIVKNGGFAITKNHGSAIAGHDGCAIAGDYGNAISQGSSSVGREGIAIARGKNVKIKGELGAILVIVKEIEEWDAEGFHCLTIEEWKAAIVDGEKIKEGVWYRLENGEFVEA